MRHDKPFEPLPRTARLLAVIGTTVLLQLAMTCAARSQERAISFIDTQAQFDPLFLSRHVGGTPERLKDIVPHIIKEMDRIGVSRTFIVPPPMPPNVSPSYDFEEIVPAIRDHRQRFAFLAGGGSLNPMIIGTAPEAVSDSLKKSFRQRALDILGSGALGFGEVTASHFSGPDVGMYEVTDADHPLLLLLADMAAEHNVPIDIHFDVVPQDMPAPDNLRKSFKANPTALKENLRAFERFLAHNRNARIVWSHAGSDPTRERTVALMRRLLQSHPNLYMSIRVAVRAPHPIAPLGVDGKLKEAWLALFSDFRDRFVMQSDAFYQMPPPLKARGIQNALALGRELLSQLPEDVARAIAYENVRRIYNLKE
jgi:hypothetical protein